ncbi:hypothetical protein N2152v2_003485 [Parachlorella kessleri]
MLLLLLLLSVAKARRAAGVVPRVPSCHAVGRQVGRHQLTVALRLLGLVTAQALVLRVQGGPRVQAAAAAAMVAVAVVSGWQQGRRVALQVEGQGWQQQQRLLDLPQAAKSHGHQRLTCAVFLRPWGKSQLGSLPMPAAGAAAPAAAAVVVVPDTEDQRLPAGASVLQHARRGGQQRQEGHHGPLAEGQQDQAEEGQQNQGEEWEGQQLQDGVGEGQLSREPLGCSKCRCSRRGCSACRRRGKSSLQGVLAAAAAAARAGEKAKQLGRKRGSMGYRSGNSRQSGSKCSMHGLPLGVERACTS